MYKPKTQILKERLDEKLQEYDEAIDNNDVKEYILFLVLRSKKQKKELLEDLKEFFEDKTDEFVQWLCGPVQDKVVKCRFFPNCTVSNCPYYHPTEIVDYK